MEIKKNFIVQLTVAQFVNIGIEFGHLKKLSHFFAGWIWLCYRNNIFVINVQKTFFFVKIGLKMVRMIAKCCRPFWFVTMNNHVAFYLIRFAHICGEPYNIFEWIGGTLSNYRMILGWFSILLKILNKNKYKLRSMDKRNLVALVGYLNKKTSNKFYAKRFNKLKGRYINRWRRSYYGRKYKKNYRKSDKTLGITKTNVFNTLHQDNTEYRANENFIQEFKADRRRGYKKRFDKFDKRFSVFSRYAIGYRKLLYYKMFVFMNFFRYGHDWNFEKFSVKSLKEEWYKRFKSGLKKKEFKFIRNFIKGQANKVDIFAEKLDIKFENADLDKYYRRYRFNFLLLKRDFLGAKYKRRVKFLNKLTSRRFIKRKFITILLRKSRKRIDAKIKKLKRNSSFNRAFKLNRWISPFDSFTKTRKPGGGFVPTYLDNIRIVDEFAVSKTPFITLVDSDIVSSNVIVPFPSNDDSLICINFFTFLIAKSIFVGKFRFLLKWRNNIIKTNESELKKKLIYFYNIKIRYKNKENILKNKADFSRRFDIFIDELVSINLEKFDVSNEIKYKFSAKFESLILFTNAEKKNYYESEIFIL